ncbi:hypothetical protein BH23BAC3_BH23BAC3_18930 [soil metagenome]
MKKSKKDITDELPVKKLTTQMVWDELVLSDDVLRQIKKIETWVLHRNKLMEEWGVGRFLKPGYKTLFYGPAGTGKTLTAALLGKKTGREVFRIELSQVVSKYIGETEKNLSSLFDRAESKDWILFFDEADAIFGKRTNVSDSHDRYANQEVSYLLQRILDYKGLVILASSKKENVDKTFLRRLQSIVHFSIPGPEERLKLWAKGFGNSAKHEAKIDLKKIAADYELSGGAIVNIIQHCILDAMNRKERVIRYDDLMDGVKGEINKL